MPDRKPKSGRSPVSQGKPYSELSPQQQKAVDLHCAGASELDAYKAAGCKGTSRGAASRYFSRLRRAIEERRAPAIRRSGLTIERCHEVLAAIVNSDPADSAPWLRGTGQIEDIPEHARLAISSTEVDILTREDGSVSAKRKIRRETKTAALRLALEALGGLKQSPEQAKADALAEIAAVLGKPTEALAE